MKKLLLFSALSVMAFAGNAQNRSIVRVDNNINTNYLPLNTGGNMLEQLRALRPKPAAANKTTASGTRVYNYVDALSLLNTAISNNQSSPYLWRYPDMYSIYSAQGGGVERDTMELVSLATVLTPWYSLFNDPAYPDATFALTAGDPYKVDSIAVYGSYIRNPNKFTATDTLRISLVYGAGIQIQSFSDDHFTTNFGQKNISMPVVGYDTIKGTAAGSSVVTKDVLLHASDTGTTNTLDRFVIAVGQNIPKTNLVGATITFISGEPYTPWDTVFLGSGFPVITKYGMFRPAVFEENKGGFLKYTPGNYNQGGVHLLPDNGNGWKTSYVPAMAYFDGSYALELPYVDFIISTTSAPALGVANVQQAITASAYPNPAAAEVAVGFALNTAADANVSLTNTVGQVIKAQSFKNVKNAIATFDVSNLSNGVYFYTVEANGQRQTSRVVVSH